MMWVSRGVGSIWWEAEHDDLSLSLSLRRRSVRQSVSQSVGESWDDVGEQRSWIYLVGG